MSIFPQTCRYKFLFLSLCKAFLVMLIVCTVAKTATAQNYEEVSYKEAFSSLKPNRDRLLTTYAQQLGYSDANQVWSVMTPSQKGVFLTITDYLGRRSLMNFNENYTVEYVGDEDDQAFGCAGQNEGRDIRMQGAVIHPINYYGPNCFEVSAETCVQQNKCYVNNLPRSDWDVILNHVEKIYGIVGTNGGCGGGNYHRLYFKADDELIYLFRNIQIGLPTWAQSEDIAGPHSPFNVSREGTEGKPRGQVHFWAWDYNAQTLNRPGVYGVYDPHIIEMDIDYNWQHDSNPECSYNGTYGRYFYQNYWSTRGLGGNAELDYSPN